MSRVRYEPNDSSDAVECEAVDTLQALSDPEDLKECPRCQSLTHKFNWVCWRCWQRLPDYAE